MDLRTYRNPSAAITSAIRKEMDRMRPEIAGLPGSSKKKSLVQDCFPLHCLVTKASRVVRTVRILVPCNPGRRTTTTMLVGRSTVAECTGTIAVVTWFAFYLGSWSCCCPCTVAVCHDPLADGPRPRDRRDDRRDDPMDFRDRDNAWARYRDPRDRDRDRDRDDYYDHRDDRRGYFDDRDRLSDPGHPSRPPPRWMDEPAARLQ